MYKFLTPKKGDVAELITHAREITKLEKQFRILLDETLRDHVQLANFRDNTLFLTVKSPVWASKVRYMGPALLQKLQNNPHLFPSVEKIEIKVLPASAPARKAVEVRQLSKSASHCLHDMANALDNEELKQALNRLASRAHKLSSK